MTKTIDTIRNATDADVTFETIDVAADERAYEDVYGAGSAWMAHDVWAAMAHDDSDGAIIDYIPANTPA